MNYPQNDGSDWPSESPAQTSRPEIRDNMADQSARGDFQDTYSNSDYQLPATIYDTTENSSRENEQYGYGDGRSRNEYESNLSDGTGSNKTLFPLLLSWVLLSGSGAGNAYLWWSYLDVRNKYRGMVHGSPRRRDRYDE